MTDAILLVLILKTVLSCVDGSLFASTDLMIKPVRSSLVFGLLARRTWPLALMVSTNQVPFRNSNSKRSGQSKGRLGLGLTKFHHLIGLANSCVCVSPLNYSHLIWLISG